MLVALGAMLLAVFGVSVVAFGDAGSDPARLPLGDGKVTTAGPKKGYVYVCRTSNAPAGAFRDGAWIRSDGTFDLTSKAVVDGSVSWPGQVTFKTSGASIAVSGNGLPAGGASTGVFPIAPSDDAYQYDRNPNSVAARSVSYTLPANPKLASRPTCLTGGPIGIAKNGVAIFNALDANDRDAVAHETQDACGGHPQQSGVYHYHSIPSCLTDGEATNRPSGLVGYALDGIPIYGPRGEGGKLVTNDDLDACHGRTSWVTFNGKRVRIYHYQATLEYPYTVGCFRATPVSGAVGGPG